MKKRRSSYVFQLNCDPSLASNLINGYLQANGYILENCNGEQCYKAGDAMIGHRFFNYELSNQTLTVSAWLKGVFGELSIEKGALNIPAMDYRNSLNILFQEISKLNNVGENMDNNNQQNNVNNINQNQVMQQTAVSNPTQVAQTFQSATDKKKETMCEIGFWLSIAGLLISFFGVSFGLIIYIADFYCASQGLKTRKKGKAIATIVMSSLSLIIIVAIIVLK